MSGESFVFGPDPHIYEDDFDLGVDGALGSFDAPIAINRTFFFQGSFFLLTAPKHDHILSLFIQPE